MHKITKTIRGYTFDWYSETELLKLFPNAREIIPEKIIEYKKLATKQRKLIEKLIVEVNCTTNDEFSRWFAKEIIAMEHIGKLLEHERHIVRLNRQLNYYYPSMETEYSNNFGGKIEHAKSVPIEEVVGRFVDLKKNGKNYKCHCPFHDDKSPSFYVYTDKQNYHCYGCGVHGSVIDFIMNINGCSFGEAVEFLQK